MPLKTLEDFDLEYLALEKGLISPIGTYTHFGNKSEFVLICVECKKVYCSVQKFNQRNPVILLEIRIWHNKCFR